MSLDENRDCWSREVRKDVDRHHGGDIHSAKQEDQRYQQNSEAVIERLSDIDFYRNAFAAEFADGLTELNLGAALSAYQRALLSADSPFDRWFYGGDTHAVEPAVKRGFELFRNKDCASCHVLDHRAAHFTDDDFHNTGVR